MLSASPNPALYSLHEFSGESFVPPPTNLRCRKKKQTATSASYTSAAPEREISALKLRTATSFYEVLGIPIGATSQEIKSAYRRLARIFHPDVAAADQKSSSADDFMRIHAAYDTLSDPGKRSSYDRQLLVLRRRTGLYSTTSSPIVSRFYGYSGRNWETDQCW